MLISEKYRDLNKHLHETNAAYGTSSDRWAAPVAALCNDALAKTLLDYGCGKGLLKQRLKGMRATECKGILIREYDPAIPGKDAEPEAADIIACTDVFEHIEPMYINGVLDHIQSLMRKAGFFTIATVPAKKKLADGRNAHILIKSPRWWLDEVHERFEILQWIVRPSLIIAIVAPRTGEH